jgi:putative SOS response-associated peptidase YedK
MQHIELELALLYCLVDFFFLELAQLKLVVALDKSKKLSLNMCFSYAINFSPESLKSKFGIKDVSLPLQGFFFNGFEHPEMPILSLSENEVEVTNMHWGLIPNWVKSKNQALNIRKNSLNARSETAYEKPMFCGAWESHPCIVLASGFFEWKQVNKEKIPHYIYASNGEILTMAGIYDIWTNNITGENIKSFSILTTHANQMMAEIHNVKHRMPVILRQENLKSWLNSNASERLNFCKPCNNAFLTAHTVSQKLNSNKIYRNESWAIEPAIIANQTTLF